MHPSVLLQGSDVSVKGGPVPTSSIQGLPGYEEATSGGLQVAAVTMRHCVKYQWATRPRGSTHAEVYRQSEFMTLDEPAACYPTFMLHRPELLEDLIRSKFDDPDVRKGVCDAVRQIAREALGKGWESARVDVEVETGTLMSYDCVRWWWPVPCALPAGPSSTSDENDGNPLEELEMEVYMEDAEGGGAEACAICLEDFVPGKEVERLPCRHRFHGECVLQWLDGEGSCPLCRSEFRIK